MPLEGKGEVMRARADDAGPDDFEGQCELCGLEAGLCMCPECPRCGGSGFTMECYGKMPVEVKCQECDGRGIIQASES